MHTSHVNPYSHIHIYCGFIVIHCVSQRGKRNVSALIIMSLFCLASIDPLELTLNLTTADIFMTFKEICSLIAAVCTSTYKLHNFCLFFFFSLVFSQDGTFTKAHIIPAPDVKIVGQSSFVDFGKNKIYLVFALI